MTADRRSWRKPEMTVLVRSRREEAVLGVCKLTGAGGPPSNVAGCLMTNKKGVCQTRNCSQSANS
jgi:hypothetical protein